MKATQKQQIMLDHIKKCEASKRSISDYARQHGIKPQQLYQARSDLRKRESKKGSGKPVSAFSRVQIQHTAAHRNKSGQFEARLKNGLILQFDIDDNIDTIRHTVVVLSSIST